MLVCSESFPESVVNDACCGCGDCDDDVAEDDCEEDEAAPADAASRLPTRGLRPMPLSAPPPTAEEVSESDDEITALPNNGGLSISCAAISSIAESWYSQWFPSLKLAFLLGLDGVLALECGRDDGAECGAPAPPPPPLGDVSDGEP